MVGSMRGHSQAGFTIIEVMLFVAVSGLLMSGLLIGTGTSIARQRYKDSVSTFHSSVQQLYEEVAAPYNNRTTAVGSCGSSPVAGTSDCVLLGKMLVVNDQDMTYYDVIGKEPAHTTAVSNEDSLLQSYHPQVVREGTNANIKHAQLEWGARVRAQGATQALPMSLLVIRSPESGFIHSYSTGGDKSISDKKEPLSAMITSVNKSERMMCIDSADIFSDGEKMALRIKAGASSATALDVVSNDQPENGAKC